MTSPPPPPPIRACLFDMDGLLLNTEDLYTACTNALLATFSRPPLPWSLKAQLQGRPGPEAGKLFRDWAQLPIPEEEYMTRLKTLQRETFPSCEPLPGIRELLSRLGKSSVEVALATSSHEDNFRLKIQKHEELMGVFPATQRVLGDDGRIPKGKGKPAPDIYLLALETINARRRGEGVREVGVQECLVFEDSVAGVEAGRRAGMQVCWVPHEGLLEVLRGREEEVLAGGMEREVGGSGEGMVGRVGDGWGRRFGSLEEFDYGGYGIDA
ncbi:hypothetical protein B0A50_00511 [Salinomyces thailandicus]|uniref:HAD superfamily hydrolase n=1 Tax=Salinomyces thailandicus TaxID=706561 RepID=A0A4U0UGP6_9PEZI|nr:hypothetical protein B0A50_00511 [Salinomyces thailandica]